MNRDISQLNTQYTVVMMKLREELKIAFDQTDNGGLWRFSDKCREIFRDYPQDDFIEKMQA